MIEGENILFFLGRDGGLMLSESMVLQTAAAVFSSGTMRALVKEIVSELTRKSPLSLDSQSKDPLLERPENRMAFGRRRVEGKEVLTVCLEKEDGPAYNEALALQKQMPETVLLEVVGLAQSVWPQDHQTKGSGEPWELVPGCSVGHTNGRAGSLGVFVSFEYPRGPRDYKKGKFHGFTSASHVLGINNKAEFGDHIVSPARPDSQGESAFKVGTLGFYNTLAHYLHQNDPEAILNTADIGVVELDVDIKCSMQNAVVDPARPKKFMTISGVLSEDDLIAHLNEPVYMTSRTSGFSEGILHIAGLGVYPIRLPNKKSYLYKDLYVVRPKDDTLSFSAGGDSGAPVYTAQGKLAGFLVAGSPKHSFFQPAHTCLKSIKATLCTAANF